MIGRAEALAELEHRVGHAFADRDLLDQALTHASVGERYPAAGHNERLEFLGDRVLNLVIAEELVRRMPKADEGELSRIFHQLVNYQACAVVARAAGVPDALRLGGGASKAGMRESERVLGDACEALIAALYLDAGLDAARGFILRLWADLLSEPDAAQNPKTQLQEWALAQGRPLPEYRVLQQTGSAHDPRFVVEVAVHGYPPVSAEARSKREAEKLAAEQLLRSQKGTL